MKDKEFADVYKEDFLGHWTKMTEFRKPIVAAVSGYAVSFTLQSLTHCCTDAESSSEEDVSLR
jgi:enoyl-CoA hydratase/carnithine racemase